MSETKTGGCQCGEVTYTLTGEPLLTYVCYCLDCQTRTGSAFSMGMPTPTAQLDIRGELDSWQRTSDAGNLNSRYYCACCGNNIYSVGSDMPDIYKLQAGTLDDTSQLKPDIHVWASRAPGWITIPDGVPVFDTQPADAGEAFAAIEQAKACNNER